MEKLVWIVWAQRVLSWLTVAAAVGFVASLLR